MQFVAVFANYYPEMESSTATSSP